MKGLINKQLTDHIWSLKYRPQKIEDLILPDRILNIFKNIEKGDKLQNLLLSGVYGIGKTSLSFLLSDYFDFDTYYFNASKDTSIDVIRSKLEPFVTNLSIDGRQKMIIGDEMDRMSPQASDSLKSFIETHSKNCTFIFITNHVNKIIPALLSRLNVIDFTFNKEEQKSLKKQLFKMIVSKIFKNEGITEFNKNIVAKVINNYYPDIRQILNKLQNIHNNENLNADSYSDNINDEDIIKYGEILKSKKFFDIKEYIVNINNPDVFISLLYDKLDIVINNKENIPEAIILLAKYSYEIQFVTDIQISLMALSLQLMEL